MNTHEPVSQVPILAVPKHLAARHSAQRRENFVQILAVVVAIACIVGAGLLMGPINQVRKQRQFVIDPESLKGLPPDIALLGRLGTFRALAIDWAAIRADRLKEEGKTYEALQLHETICALAPRFPQVWVNAAWNMAYNISVAQFTPESRWKWVRNGLELLRDRGIQYNPYSVTLYKELSWIYWHKVGDFLDDEHLNYKRGLAIEMELILGPAPITLKEKDYIDWFAKIVDAPRDLEKLIDTDADVARLVSKLDALGLKADPSLLSFVARNIRPELRNTYLSSQTQNPESLDAQRIATLTSDEDKQAIALLLSSIRSKVLREQNKFNLDWMLELMEEYGPLDWRNAFAHSLYWSDAGTRLARGHENTDKNDEINNARFVFFAMQKLVVKGRMTLWPDFDDPFSSYLELTPDLRYIPYLFDTYMRLGKEHYHDDPRYREGTPGPAFMNGFVTSMHTWIELLYLEGGNINLEQAENFYAWLREYNREPDGSVQPRYLKTLDQFVMGDLYDQLQTYKAASSIVRSFIRRSLKQFSLGLIQTGTTSLIRAKQARDIWQIATKIDTNERRKMQRLIFMVRDDVEAFLSDPRVLPIYKARLWKNLPLIQRQMSYDHLRDYFVRLCAEQALPWDLNRAFPVPAGLSEFRKKEFDLIGAPRREDVEMGKRFNR